MSTTINTSINNNLKVSHAAHSLNLGQRQKIGIQSVGGHFPISHIADRYGVSRKFIYQQKEKTLKGISQAFEERLKDDSKVIFYLPITKAWVCQFILALILICRSPYQAVVELLRDLFDYEISKGGVHNVVYKALEKTKNINKQ